MKKRILAILLTIALLSSLAVVVAYAADEGTYSGGGNTTSSTSDGQTTYTYKCTWTYTNDTKCDKCNAFVVSSQTGTGSATVSSLTPTDNEKKAADDQAKAAAKKAWDDKYSEHYNKCCVCATCGQSFTSLDSYQNHLTVAHPEKHYYCPYDNCPYNPKSSNYNGSFFADNNELEAHLKSMHEEDANALHCPYKNCHYIAYSISDYNNHIAANHQKDGEQITPRDNIQRFFDKYFMGIGLNVNENSFSSVVRIFAYVTEVFMSVFTDSGASEVFQFAGDSGVTYFFETIVPHFWALFTE